MATSFQELDYLRPPASAKQIVHEEGYKKKMAGSRRIRRVFYKTEFDEVEKQKIEEFEVLIKQENVQLPAWWNQQECLRWCYSKRLELPQSLGLLKNYLEWSQNPKFHTLTPAGMSALKQGVVYQLGRDSKMRPIMVVDIPKIVNLKIDIEDFMNALIHVQEIMHKRMLLPGHVENTIVLIETNGLSLLNVPIGHLGSIIQTASNNYPESLAKMYILNPNFILRTSWNLIKNLMEPETADKIGFIKSDDFELLQEMIPVDQLEEKYGGTIPNLTEYYPPRLTVPADQIIWNNSQYEAGKFDPNMNYKLRRNKKIPNGANVCQNSGGGRIDDHKSISEISEEAKEAANRSALSALMHDSFKDCLNSSQFPKLHDENAVEMSMYYSAQNLPGGEPSVHIVEKAEAEEEEEEEEEEEDGNRGGGMIIPAGALIKMNNRRQISLEAHAPNQNGEMFCGICRRPDDRTIEDEPKPEVEDEQIPGKEECTLI